jgi:hypothetical protein
MAKEEKPTEEKPTEETEATTTESEETPVSEEVEPAGEETSDFTPKFTQLQAKDKEEYLTKLEDAYLNSSKEAQRIKGELTDREQELQVLAKIVGSDPALKESMAKKLYDEGYDDPFSEGITVASLTKVMRQVLAEELPKQIQQTPALQRLEEDKKQADREVYNAFIEKHPDIVTNPDLSLEFEEAIGAQFRILEKQGKKPDITTVMEKAWKMVGGSETSTEDAELEGMTKMAQKEASSMGSISTGGASKSTGKRILSPEEQRIAKMMGMTDEAYLEGKKLAEKQEEEI